MVKGKRVHINGYILRSTPEFETYLENSRAFSKKIYIPVKNGL